MTQRGSVRRIPSAKASPAASSAGLPKHNLHPNSPSAAPSSPVLNPRFSPQLTPRKAGNPSHPSSEGSGAAVPDPRNNREKALRSTRGQQTQGAGTRNRGDTAWQVLCRQLHCKIQAGCFSTSTPSARASQGPPLCRRAPPACIPPLPRCQVLPQVSTPSPAPR